MNTTILVVEDDLALCDGIRLSLEGPSTHVYQAHSLAEAQTLLANEHPNLLILDINLPDGSGLDFCRQIRQTSQLPIVFLTANDLETDVVTGLAIGGDDYITKPFSLAILRARVSALLRRAAKDSQDNRYAAGPFLFDFDGMRFTRHGEEIVLSRTEQKALRILTANHGHTVTRDLLLEKVWGSTGDYVDENAVSVTISRLRTKLKDGSGGQDYIRTVYGLGYCWEVPADE